MKKLGMIFAILVGSLGAQAGWLIEPMVGYSTGTQLSYKYGATPTTYTYSEGSVPMGGSLGYEFSDGFFVGLDGIYNYAGTLTSQISSITNSENFTRGAIGAKVAFRVGKVSVFAGYNPLVNTYMISTTSNPLWLLNGTGAFGGFTFKAANHFDIIARYDYYSYSNYETGTTKATSTAISGSAAAGAISGTPTDSSVSVMIGIPFGSSGK